MAESTSTPAAHDIEILRHSSIEASTSPSKQDGLFIQEGPAPPSNEADARTNEARQTNIGREIHVLQDQTNLLPFKQTMFVFTGLSCALFCSFLDQTIISTAVPTLGREFNDSAISSWIGTSYLLTSTVCQPLYGRLSDIFGRKAILTGSMVIFLIGSILCAISQSMTMLIVFRALQGIGGGGILTTVQTVVTDVVTLQQRGMYEGILGAVISVSNAIGPLMGGVFVEKVSWRWCFYINIPLTSLAILIVLFGLPLKRVEGGIKHKLKQIDYTGSFLMSVSAILILLPISWGGSMYPWNSAAVIAPLVFGVVSLGPFIYVEIAAAVHPIIPMHIFKNGTVSGVMFGNFFMGFMFYINLYFLPQFYQVVRGASPVQSGILIIPLVVSQTVTSLISGFMVSRTGNYRIQMTIGYFLWTVACGLLTLISPTITDAELVGFQILSGVGAGSTFMTGLIAIQASLPRNLMAVATGTRNFLRLLGGTIALAAASAILNNSVQTDLSSALPSDIVKTIILDPTQITSGVLGLSQSQQSVALLAYTHGVRNIYYFMIPCCAMCFIATTIFVKGQKTLKREDDERLKEEGKAWVAQNKNLRPSKKAPSGQAEAAIELPQIMPRSDP